MNRLIILSLIIVATTLSVGFYSSTTSGKDIKFVKAENPVPGRYIVVLDEKEMAENTDHYQAEAAALAVADHYAANIDQIYTSALKGFSAEMSAKQALELSRDDRVLYVEEDSIAYVSSPQSSDWGLDRIDQRDLPLNGAFMYAQTGANVNVYVMDTGIKPTHVEFGGRASVAYDALSDGQNGIDCHGHGTHVAGIIGSSTYGVAKNTNLYGVRVLPCNGYGFVSDMISGVNWVKANRVNPAVVNMSINVSAVSNSLDTAIGSLISSGVTFVASAGNQGANACSYSPGPAPGAIIVGATGNNDARASYSNYGACVDIFAPGSSITSLGISSDTATRVMSGTSMASPMVAGTAALYLELNPTASPATVSNRLGVDATSGTITNIDTVSPNKLLYTWLSGAVPPTPASVTIVKQISTVGGGTASSESFTYSAVNLGSSSFSLVDNDVQPADRYTNSGVFLFGSTNTISVTEQVKLGWQLNSISCVETAGNGMPNSQNTSTDLGSRTANIIVEEGETVVCTFSSQELAPSSAPGSISGRLSMDNGRALRGSSVRVTNMTTGQEWASVTSSFGYFTFSGLPTGTLYMVSVDESKRHVFSPASQTVTLDGDLQGIDFFASPRGNN